MPVTEDAPALWDTWVGQGGEGIVLKEQTALPPAHPLAAVAQRQAEALSILLSLTTSSEEWRARGMRSGST